MNKIWMGLLVLAILCPGWMRAEEGNSGNNTNKKNTVATSSDIAKAVRVTSKKDCGCGSCASKGCKPCKGKNCYYCVAKGLITKECGCGMCDAKGCEKCGPGCDVCKFHLAPLAETKKKDK